MRVFQRFRFKDARIPTAPQRLERAISLLRARGWTDYDLRFYFDHTMYAYPDLPHYRAVDACERLLKRFPQMRPYYVVHPEESAPNGTTGVISNLTSEWDQWNPDASTAIPDPNVILEIARGVPRSFPLSRSIYILDKIRWDGERPVSSEVLAMQRKRSIHHGFLWEPSDCLILDHSWWITRRFNGITAHVELPVSAALSRLPEVPGLSASSYRT